MQCISHGIHKLKMLPASEVVELPEHVHLREIELPLVWVISECLLGPLEGRLVLVVEFEAFRDPLKNHTHFLLPHFVVTTVREVGPTRCNHLVRHLHKKCRHPVRCVVVARVAVDHANSVHESWNGI